MAGETARCEAIVLRITPWSRTSHIVRFLTPRGILVAVIKGAVRPKSFFLGQYDLNYTCEIVHYLGGAGELRALRECRPLKERDALRGDWRRLLLADHFRALAETLAPAGDEAAGWFDLLDRALDALETGTDPSDGIGGKAGILAELLDFEMKSLALAGISPDIAESGGSFELRGERRIKVSAEVARCLREPKAEKNLQILLDAARVIGVFYTFHLDYPLEGRRAVIKSIS